MPGAHGDHIGPSLLPSIIAILTNTLHSHVFLTNLATKLIAPISFNSLLTITPPKTLTLALSSTPFSALIALSILSTATTSPSFVAALSAHSHLVAQPIHTWLSTPSIEVGVRATVLLGALLDTDCPTRPVKRNTSIHSGEEIIYPLSGQNISGQGHLWRRLFADLDIYTLLFTLISSSTPTTSTHHLSLHQRYLA